MVSGGASRAGPLSYISSLDGLRAVAILGVFIEHFPPHYRLVDLSTGGAGVSLFFVLSGYLITRILMNYDSVDVSVSRKAYHFFARRFLRLSPAYFAAIALAYAFDIHQMRELWAVHLAYLSNMLMAWRGEWLTGASHFWSLCVEEQFYLIWFFVVVLATRRSLLGAIFLAGLLTLATRLVILLFGLSPLVSMALPGQSVVLAVGALLALGEQYPLAGRITRPFSSPWVLAASVLAFSAISLRLDVEILRVLVYPFAAALVFGCIIRRAVSGELGRAEWFLSLPPMVWIGRISYGLFVYHAFVPDILYELIPGSQSWLMRTGYGLALVWFVSFLVAWISWRLLEEPCLRLKARISLYRREPILRRA